MNYIVFFFLGMYVAFATYHLLVYVGRKSDKNNLYYALIVLSFAYLTFTMDILPDIKFRSNSISNDLWNLSICISYFLVSVSVVYYIINVFGLHKYNFIGNIFLKYVLLVVSTVFILSKLPGYTFRELSPWTVYLLVPIAALLFSFLYYKFFTNCNRSKAQTYHAIGMIFFILFLLLHFFFMMADIQEKYANVFANVGMLITVIIFAKLLAKNFNDEHDELIETKVNLENRIVERTLELKNAKDQIENQSKEKTAFFINLAHEIKIPLTIVNNGVNNYIKKYGSNIELREIKYSVDTLLKDVINFLDSEKLQRGQVIYNHDQVINFSEILKIKMPSFIRIASNNNITITNEIENEVFIKADPYAIDRIVNNMIDNAIKYNKQAGVINVKLRKLNEYAEFIVYDTGIGISEENQKNIFMPYYQISHEKRNLQGIGMGLNIVYEIVMTLKGEISIYSKEGIETQFTITIPIEKIGSERKDNNYDFITEPIEPMVFNVIEDSVIDVRRNTIFIVEDNKSLLRSLRDALSNEYNVICAVNGKEAIEKLSNNNLQPDIMISDIMMDIMDGHELLKEIRSINKYKQLPVIFLTAKTTETENIVGLDLGAIDYIYKPFSMEILSVKLKSILEYIAIKKKMFEAEKFRTLGILSASISHEIMNPLSGVKGPLTLLEDDLKSMNIPLSNDIWKEVGFIKTGLSRIEETVSTLRMLYNGEIFTLELMRIKERVELVSSMVKKIYKHLDIIFEIEIPDDFEIYATPTAITQIFVNLFTNAADAIGEKKGKVSVSTKREKEYDIIEVKDNGCGIESDKIALIFDPLYTTKNIGAGTGMGLYIVKELVNKMNGIIEVKSNPCEGSIFKMLFKKNELKPFSTSEALNEDFDYSGKA